MLLILALREPVSVRSAPLRLLASEPVAVASTALMELAREATSLVRLAASDDALLSWLEMRDARLDARLDAAVRVMDRSDVNSLATLPASDDAAAAALDTLSPMELASAEAVWRMPPGEESVAVPKSWAWE